MNKLQALGLVETTSETQLKNGTRRFYDPITTCDYMSYESGYIRREYFTTSWRNDKPFRTIYQLNPTHKIDTKWGESTQRIMITDPNERLDRLAKAAANYRKTCADYQAQRDQYEIERERITTQIVASDCVSMFIEGMVDLDQTLIDLKSTLIEAKEKGLVRA